MKKANEEAADGSTYRRISIEKSTGEKYSLKGLIERNQIILKTIKEMGMTFATLDLQKVSANIALMELGLDGIAYGKLLRQTNKVVNAYRDILDITKEEKEQEIKILQQLRKDSVSVDGQASSDAVVFVK